MRTVYIDSDYKCHVTDDGTRKAVETDYFDGKCDAVVEGYCLEPSETGQKIYPWKPSDELDAEQRAYEKQLLAEYEAALKNSVPIAELEAAYREGVNSAYD